MLAALHASIAVRRDPPVTTAAGGNDRGYRKEGRTVGQLSLTRIKAIKEPDRHTNGDGLMPLARAAGA